MKTYNERVFEHKNGTLTYYEMGSGLPILFLHGGAVEAKTYKSIHLKLAQQFKVITPDIPGHGKSALPRNASLEDITEILYQFIRSLQLETVCIAGQSFGGGFALRLATRLSNVRALILIDSVGLENTTSVYTLAFRFMIRKNLIGIIKYHMYKQYLQLFIDFWKNIIRKLFRPMQILLVAKLIIASSKETVQNMGNIETQTLILWGKYDSVISPEYGEAMNQIISNSKLVIVEGHHDWCLQKPNVVAERIIDFANESTQRGK